MNVLVACEESQATTTALREAGHNAYSCDLLECSGGHPEWHFNCDMFDIINGNGGITQDGTEVKVDKWELMIAHPPCTFLSSSGATWYYHPEDKHLPTSERRPHPKYPNRAKDRDDAIEFFMKIVNSPIDKIAIENPIGRMSSAYRKPDQIVQPYHFGDEASKSTCLWLKNLPLLEHTNVVGKGEMVTYKSGSKMPKWYADALTQAKTPAERRTLRSKTFPGIAKAMANQWTK